MVQKGIESPTPGRVRDRHGRVRGIVGARSDGHAGPTNRLSMWGGGTMESAVLAAWVTAVLTGLASGVAGATTTAVAAQVGRVARERLGLDEDGRQALERLDGDPAAPGTADELRARLLLLIEGDPDFAHRIRQAAGLPAAPPASNNINIGGNVRNGVITIGPVTIRKSPGVVAVAALVVVVALSLALNGVIHTVEGDDSPWSSGGGRNRVAAVTDPTLAKGIAPDLRSMPSGWNLKSSPELDGCTEDCQGRLAKGEVRVADSAGDTRISFQYATFDGAETAETGYGKVVDGAQRTVNNNLAPMSLGTVGDASSAFSGRTYTGSEYQYTAVVYLRVGTVIGRVSYDGGYKKVDDGKLLAFARLLADRAQQAQNGEQPSASAVL
ncbi:hypothetical protein RMN57_07160 [Kitasatospora sp. CM 4170]|uniref:Integral membrane protein n=2 Tax=Kitasatospora aburaviensis TaxID=67265 RepID=A0ABW1EQ49_9ACTN|nr:hypothetical protein [Kitasatospora sp. CM 4170]WNM44502.1 hypothetical protein RMN57_07160 [Kitasatospora sp. CM 4170]